MKLLMFYCPQFGWKPFQRTADQAMPDPEQKTVSNAAVIFYHCEEQDPERHSKVRTKALKNIKWLANKFATDRIILHSFNHLSESKADADFSADLVRQVRARLEDTGYRVEETPFGWLNEWWMHVAGPSLAKVFKDI